MTANVDKARASWGKELPDWVLVLAQACDAKSGRRVADQIRYSTTVVSQVIGRKYSGSLEAVEGAVKGAFLNATVVCPVLGTLAMHACIEHQRSPYSNANPTVVKLFRACRGSCPNSLIKSAHSGKETS